MKEEKKYKIGFLVSHPIQYFSPLFKKITALKNVELTVYYCSKGGDKNIYDQGFGKNIKWDIPLLEGYRYKFLKNYSFSPTIFKTPTGLINLGISKEIFREKYDIFIVHGWHYITHWLAIASALLSKTPLLLRGDSPLNQEILKTQWKITIKKLCFKFLFKYISGFLAVGSENRKFCEFYGLEKEKIFYAPYAVDNKRFIDEYEQLKNKKEEIKKKIGISSEKTIFMFSGKLIDKKRPKDLLVAYERIDSDNKTLIFVGDGALKEELKIYAKQNHIKDTFFVGFKNQTELYDYYSVADVLVLPSGIGETWGLVVNEAMCFNLAIVVSDMVGCGPDLVKNGSNGFIFKTGDIKDLTTRLEMFINNQNLKKQMGIKSKEIISKWDYNKNIEELEKAINSITKKQR